MAEEIKEPTAQDGMRVAQEGVRVAQERLRVATAGATVAQERLKDAIEEAARELIRVLRGPQIPDVARIAKGALMNVLLTPHATLETLREVAGTLIDALPKSLPQVAEAAGHLEAQL